MPYGIPRVSRMHQLKFVLQAKYAFGILHWLGNRTYRGCMSKFKALKPHNSYIELTCSYVFYRFPPSIESRNFSPSSLISGSLVFAVCSSSFFLRTG